MINIKEATIHDVDTVLACIKELAEYERLADQVSATSEILKESLFIKKQATAILLEVDQQVAGMAIYYENFSSFIGQAGYYLEDLYVKPAYRKNGYGFALLNWIVLKAKANNIKRVEWSVLNWNTPAIEFYQSLHAKSMDEWTTYRLDEHAINYLTKEKSVLE